jgi:hypothetical protein
MKTNNSNVNEDLFSNYAIFLWILIHLILLVAFLYNEFTS